MNIDDRAEGVSEAQEAWETLESFCLMHNIWLLPKYGDGDPPAAQRLNALLHLLEALDEQFQKGTREQQWGLEVSLIRFHLVTIDGPVCDFGEVRFPEILDDDGKYTVIRRFKDSWLVAIRRAAPDDFRASRDDVPQEEPTDPQGVSADFLLRQQLEARARNYDIDIEIEEGVEEKYLKCVLAVLSKEKLWERHRGAASQPKIFIGKDGLQFVNFPFARGEVTVSYEEWNTTFENLRSLIEFGEEVGMRILLRKLPKKEHLESLIQFLKSFKRRTWDYIITSDTCLEISEFSADFNFYPERFTIVFGRTDLAWIKDRFEDGARGIAEREILERCFGGNRSQEFDFNEMHVIYSYGRHGRICYSTTKHSPVFIELDLLDIERSHLSKEYFEDLIRKDFERRVAEAPHVPALEPEQPPTPPADDFSPPVPLPTEVRAPADDFPPPVSLPAGIDRTFPPPVPSTFLDSPAAASFPLPPAEAPSALSQDFFEEQSPTLQIRSQLEAFGRECGIKIFPFDGKWPSNERLESFLSMLKSVKPRAWGYLAKQSLELAISEDFVMVFKTWHDRNLDSESEKRFFENLARRFVWNEISNERGAGAMIFELDGVTTFCGFEAAQIGYWSKARYDIVHLEIDLLDLEDHQLTRDYIEECIRADIKKRAVAVPAPEPAAPLSPPAPSALSQDFFEERNPAPASPADDFPPSVPLPAGVDRTFPPPVPLPPPESFAPPAGPSLYAPNRRAVGEAIHDCIVIFAELRSIDEQIQTLARGCRESRDEFFRRYPRAEDLRAHRDQFYIPTSQLLGLFGPRDEIVNRLLAAQSKCAEVVRDTNTDNATLPPQTKQIPAAPVLENWMLDPESLFTAERGVPAPSVKRVRKSRRNQILLVMLGLAAITSVAAVKKCQTFFKGRSASSQASSSLEAPSDAPEINADLVTVNISNDGSQVAVRADINFQNYKGQFLGYGTVMNITQNMIEISSVEFNIKGVIYQLSDLGRFSAGQTGERRNVKLKPVRVNGGPR